MMFFGTGIAAGTEKYLWNRKSLSPPLDSENRNTKDLFRKGGDYRVGATLEVAPGAGESVVITPIINGTPYARTITVSGANRSGRMTINGLARGDQLSFKASVSAGSADVKTVMVSIAGTTSQ